LYAIAFRGELKRAYLKQLEETEGGADLLDLTAEIQTLRVLAAIAIDRMSGGDGLLTDLDNPDQDVLATALATVGRGGVAEKWYGKVSSSLADERSDNKKEKPEKRAPSVDDMMTVLAFIRGIVKSVETVAGIINDERLTTAEIVFMLGALRETIDEFIPDKKTREAFISRLREKIPGAAG
jgi:hypothetical protein